MDYTFPSFSEKELKTLDLTRLEKIGALIQHIRAGVKAEVELYASLLVYRVERDLYELILETGQCADLSWEEFLAFLDQDPQMRNQSAAILMTKALTLSPEDYFTPPEESDFDVLETEDFQDSETLRSIQILPPEMGRSIVHLLMIQGQHFLHQRMNEEGVDLTWSAFQRQLYEDPYLWDDFQRCFHFAIRQISFKDLWQMED